MHQLLHYILNIDTYLIAFVSAYGAWTYLALFAIIFCETGLIVTPFLPGDSLLFTVGTLAALTNSPFNIFILFILLVSASILGNQVNYLIGSYIGPRIFTAKNAWFLNKAYLEQAHRFYEKHGGKTIILARFIPIIRTFAPFIAGVSYMQTSLFTFYNIISAALWIGSLLFFGYFCGTLPLIKANFSLVIYSIILISILPPIVAFLYGKVMKST